jgi:hypothetical protein
MRRALIALIAVAVCGALASTTFGGSTDAPEITIDASPNPAEATDSTGADVSYHVKSHLDLDVTCTPTGGPASDFTTSSHFALGTSSIDCSDTNGNSASETVVVQDTTPPTVTVPSGASGMTNDPSGTASVSWDPSTVSATDLVDGSVSATCSPASGSSFPLGGTTVTCSATDAHGNTGSASFTVTVTYNDTTAPTFGAHPDITAEATSAAGATVNYSVTATDESGTPPSVVCSPAPGTFALGQTPVSCTATDAANNPSNASFTVTVQDTTKPTLNLPANITVEADSTSGKAVTYSASASDAVSGSLPADCSPASGSTFGITTTTVNCSAHDAAGNTQTGTFTVTVTDSAGPAFSSVPADRQVEANGGGGSIVNYTAPTASDVVDGPALVTCNPPSGSLFPLGTTTVTCSAVDAHSNSSNVSFSIRVLDTTPPSLIVPADQAIYADTPDGISAQSHYVATFLSGAHAVDSVDPNPVISEDAPDFLTVGIHVVNFFARDASGNVAAGHATLDIRPMPPAGTPPLPVPPPRTAPKDVTALKAEPGDARVRLSWQLPNGVDHVEITRDLSVGGNATIVYTGSGRTFTDRGLVNGVEYRYLVVSVDAAGNRSAGVAATALPKPTLLRSPKDGAKLKAPPKLLWARNAEASYYNVQLFRGEVKILSTWPVGTSLKLKHTWKYQGRRYTLAKGVYRWYVWPGFGARAAVDYGELLGSSSFQITR